MATTMKPLQQPTPFQPDPQEAFLAQRARMGGFDPPITFTDLQEKILNLAADEMIPPGGGFPAPSTVGIVGFIARYVAPDGTPAVHYPFAEERPFKARVDALGKQLLKAETSERAAVLEEVSKQHEEFFAQLLGLAYYGYYSRSAVIQAVSDNIEAARDYHGPPQPLGYLSVTEQWEESEIQRDRGSYLKTREIKRLPLGNH
jgi:hypothetical protein